VMYREHYAMIRRIMPKERLLEFELKDGWEPLCRFLGKDIPDVPFPRVNDTEHMKEHMRLVVWRGVRNALTKCVGWVVTGLLILLGFWLIGRGVENP